MPADKAISSRSAARVGSLAAAERLARVLGLVVCAALAACGGGLVPVHNIHNAPVIAESGREPGLQNVRDAIMRALLSRGWQVDREGPDGVVATTVSRGNSATVLVQYDAQAYSISYLDSSPSLKFNGTSIHRHYNEWVDRLDKSIRKLLAEVDHYPLQAVIPVTPPGAASGEPAPPVAAGPAPAPPPAAGAPEVAPQAKAAPQYEAPPSPPPPAPAPRK